MKSGVNLVRLAACSTNRRFAACPSQASGIFQEGSIGTSQDSRSGCGRESGFLSRLAGMVSDSKSTSRSVRRDLGGRPSRLKSGVATAVGAPVGVVTGAVRWSIEGTGHGLQTGYKKPFSKQSAGL